LISLQNSTKIFLYRFPADMRKSFHGLEILVREVLKQDPLSGHLFVFLNKKRTHLKTLYWDRDGFCLFYKKLEQGTFISSFDNIQNMKCIEPTLFSMLVSGIELNGIKRRKRMNFNPN